MCRSNFTPSSVPSSVRKEKEALQKIKLSLTAHHGLKAVSTLYADPNRAYCLMKTNLTKKMNTSKSKYYLQYLKNLEQCKIGTPEIEALALGYTYGGRKTWDRKMKRIRSKEVEKVVIRILKYRMPGEKKRLQTDSYASKKHDAEMKLKLVEMHVSSNSVEALTRYLEVAEKETKYLDGVLSRYYRHKINDIVEAVRRMKKYRVNPN